MPTKTKEKPKASKIDKTVSVRRNGHSNGVVKAADKKAVKPIAEKSKAKKKGAVDYAPTQGSMRHFLFKALHGKPASANMLKKRAAKLATKEGVKKYGDPEAYKGFDVAFFVKMLEDKGVAIERDGEKYSIAA